MNEKEELGLPFDLLIRKKGDFSSLFVGEAVDISRVQKLADETAAGGQDDVVFVEVKSTSAGNRSIFEVSINEVASMKSLGANFWLARTYGVPSGPDASQETKVRLWPNVSKAVRNGEVKLLMLV